MNPHNNDQSDQKNLLIAVALCGLLMLVWPYEPPVQPPQPGDNETPVEQTESGAKTTTPETSAQSETPETTLKPTEQSTQVEPAVAAKPVFERQDFDELKVPGEHGMVVSNAGGSISKWTLYEEQYQVHMEDEASQPFDFVARAPESKDESVFLPPEIRLTVAGETLDEDDLFTEVKAARTADSMTLRWVDPNQKITVDKTFTIRGGNYLVDVGIAIKNGTGSAIDYTLETDFSALQNDEQAEGTMFMPPVYLFNSICEHGDDFERLPATDIFDNVEDDEADENRFESNVVWGGIDNRYFMTGLAIKDGILSCSATAERAGEAGVPAGYTRINNRLVLKSGRVEAGATETRTLSLYGGPKKLSYLRSEDVPVNMSEAIDFGFFAFICEPMLWLMRYSHTHFPNWGIAIILLTILVKVLTLPLTIKQYRSMAAMKKLGPQLKKIQERHKEDKVRLQQEMMKLYRENQVNPLSGCLPMLMMMPVYFALYRTIYSAVELYQADFAFWIRDLSEQDPYYISPFILGLLMIIQMRLNPSAGDQAQQKILMWVMPIMFTGMMLFLPSGLVLYILVNTLLGIVQQWYMYRGAGALNTDQTDTKSGGSGSSSGGSSRQQRKKMNKAKA